MLEVKVFLAIIGIIITIVAPLPYLRDIIKGKTKPHFITWLIWSIVAGTGFALQLIGGGGFGSWVLGFTAFMNIVILVFSVKKSKYAPTSFDMLILSLALLSIVAWKVTNNNSLAAVFITTTMALGYIPTYIKSFSKPSEETISLFFMSAVKQAFGVAALSAYNVPTTLFPAFLLIANIGLTLLIITRRRQLT